MYLKVEATLLSIVLVSQCLDLTAATSDPNVFRKNETENEDLNDPTKYVSVNLVDELVKSRLYDYLQSKKQSPTSARFEDNGIKVDTICNFRLHIGHFNIELEIEGTDSYDRKLMESDGMLEGDIRTDVKSIGELRNAIIDPRLRWPNAVIPYVISTDFRTKWPSFYFTISAIYGEVWELT